MQTLSIYLHLQMKKEETKYTQMAELILETYTLEDLSLHNNEFFLLYRYFEEIEHDSSKVLSILSLSIIRNMTSISNYGDYFALLEMINLSKTMMDTGHRYSAKRLYTWAKEWIEEYKETKLYDDLKYSITELEKYIQYN